MEANGENREGGEQDNGMNMSVPIKPRPELVFAKINEQNRNQIVLRMNDRAGNDGFTAPREHAEKHRDEDELNEPPRHEMHKAEQYRRA